MQNPLSRSVKIFACLIFISTFLLTQSVVAQNDPQIKKGENSLSIKLGDQTRHFLLYIPSEYDFKTPLPLVFLFHGTGTSSKSVMRATGFSEVAEKKKIIVAAPDGIYVYGGRTSWNYQLVAGGVNDVEFVKELIKEIISKVAVDKKRIYAAGYSAGAGMSYRLSCELSNVFAAIGVVASAPLHWDCEKNRSVSVIAFHGTHDAANPYSMADKSIASWVKNNACNNPPITTKISEDVIKITYGGCKDNAEAIFFRINEGGHTWPDSPIAEVYERAGLGKVNRDINATNLIWRFFEAHPMP